jgi:hypothetical protein
MRTTQHAREKAPRGIAVMRRLTVLTADAASRGTRRSFTFGLGVRIRRWRDSSFTERCHLVRCCHLEADTNGR